MLRDLPWELPRKNIDCIIWCPTDSERAMYTLAEYEKQYREEISREAIFTGSIGTIIGMTIHTDLFSRPIKDHRKYSYALTKTKDRKGHFRVAAHLWPHEDIGLTVWYIFRSARQAHVALKRVAKRR